MHKLSEKRSWEVVGAGSALLLLVAANAAWADDPPAARAAKPAPALSVQLDLAAPPIDHVLSHADIASLTTEQDELPVPDVSVQGERYQTPVPRGTFRALPWAFMHPLQAWRIFTPVTE